MVCVAVGWAVALVLVRLGQPARQPESALALSTVALLVSAPLSAPLGLLGGIVAKLLLSRQRSRLSLVVWVIRGMGAGGACGALCAPAALLLLARASSPGAQGMAAVVSQGGAVAGVISGASVGLWCHWLQQGRSYSRRIGGPTMYERRQ